MAVKAPQKFTPEEIKEVAEVQKLFNQLTFQFGQLTLSKISIEKQELYLVKKYSTLEDKEKELAKKFTDIETGEFTSIK